MKPETAPTSTTPTRLTALLLGAAALLHLKPSKADAREPAPEWIHPALTKYDDITELAYKVDCKDVGDALTKLRPQIAYLASLDPRE